MRARARVLHVVLYAACLTGACAEPPADGNGGPRIDDPEAVVERWNETRNHGEVDAALALLADDASVLGFRLDEPGELGAQTMLSLLDEYETSTRGATP